MKNPGLNLALAAVLSLGLLSPAFAQDNSAKKAKNKAATANEGAGTRQKPVGTARPYKKVNGRDLRLFVLNPRDWQATDQRPAIVFFHGGGWEIGKGGPTQFNAQSEYLVTRGLVCIQVEYRLIANNRKEAPIGACEDAKSAMRWVRSHAAELGIDPARIAASGGSAGGHLAAFVGMVDGTDDPQDDLKISCRPAAMVLFCPALLHEDDVASTAAESARPSVTSELKQRYAAISPYLHVSRDDPPGLILVGSEDGVLPPGALKGFQALCKTAGVRMDAVVYPGEGHSFFGISRSLDRFYDTVVEMDKFLGSLGWLAGPPTLTRAQVQRMAEGVTPAPNKTQKAKAKAKSP